MDNKTIIIIVVAAVAVLAVALCLLLILKKKKKGKTEKDIIYESKDLVSANAQTVEVLLVLAKGKEDTIKELKSIQDKLKYLSPSTNEKVKALDEKIKDVLGDLKIELSKKREEEKDDKVASLLEDIRVKIAERSTFTDGL